MPAYLSIHRQMTEGGLDLLIKHSEDFPPQYIDWINRHSGMTVLDLYKDQEVRTSIYDCVDAVFKDYDLIITPTVACQPVHNSVDGNTLGPSSINGETIDQLIGWCLTYVFNFTGHPAASVPIGLSKDKLPIGMQIVGRRDRDEDVLIASAAFEQMRPWKDSYKLCDQRVID